MLKLNTIRTNFLHGALSLPVRKSMWLKFLVSAYLYNKITYQICYKSNAYFVSQCFGGQKSHFCQQQTVKPSPLLQCLKIQVSQISWGDSSSEIADSTIWYIFISVLWRKYIPVCLPSCFFSFRILAFKADLKMLNILMRSLLIVHLLVC